MPPTVQEMIQQAAAANNVDPNAMLTIAGIESNYNPNAHNASGASGLFQFMPGTAQQYGLENPYDPAASADAAARLTRDNAASLRQRLGREPTTGELYLAHQQGAAGAGVLLAHPDESAVDALSRVYGSRARAQAAVTQNGGTAGMTARQFATMWTGRADARAGLIPPANIPGTGALGGMQTAANGGLFGTPLPAPSPLRPPSPMAGVMPASFGTSNAGAQSVTPQVNWINNTSGPIPWGTRSNQVIGTGNYDAQATVPSGVDPRIYNPGMMQPQRPPMPPMPRERPSPPMQQGGGYQVKNGDTLSGIASRFGTSVPALAQANGISNPNMIRAGVTLAIPSPPRPMSMPSGFGQQQATAPVPMSRPFDPASVPPPVPQGGGGGGGGLFGGLMSTLGGLGSQVQGYAQQAAQQAPAALAAAEHMVDPGAVARAMLGTVSGRTAIIDPMVRNLFSSGHPSPRDPTQGHEGQGWHDPFK